jgi:predicted enzyme related to lactoylglutathione lyase
MLSPDVYPPGVPCWIDLGVPDPDGAAAFYAGVLGWDVAAAGPSSSYLVARLDGATVAGIRPDPASGDVAWRTYVCVDDADAAVASVVEAGGRVVSAAAPVDGVARVAVVADPGGAVFGLWQPDGIRGAGRVNAPGTWNFSNLATGSPSDDAVAFYGNVFGWQARPAQLGPETSTMLCLPGYGETQDAKEPGFLRRHAEGGTPPGFTDAFGWLEPAPAPDAPAAWTVTFAVDDADAVVDRVLAGGGAVTVPAFDAGPARLAVVADPWGAPFTVSAYQPDS